MCRVPSAVVPCRRATMLRLSGEWRCRVASGFGERNAECRVARDNAEWRCRVAMLSATQCDTSSCAGDSVECCNGRACVELGLCSKRIASGCAGDSVECCNGRACNRKWQVATGAYRVPRDWCRVARGAVPGCRKRGCRVRSCRARGSNMIRRTLLITSGSPI